MKKLLTLLFALLAAPAFGQGLQLPNNQPANTIMGRLGTAGQAQAIPFATVTANLWSTQTANTVFAGPTTAPSQLPAFRALVGADLPNPSSSTLGGVQSLATASHFFMTGISTSGVPSAAQPACADLSTAAASCSTDTTNATNISSGTLNTARLPSPFTSGTASGNTSKFATTTGTLTNGHCASFDASGNVQDSGGVCGSSALVLLNTLTASNSATLSDTTSLTATYSTYEIVFQNIVPATNNTTLELQVHSGGSFPATTYVANTGVLGAAFSNSAPTTFIQLSEASSLLNTGNGYSGTVRVSNVTQTSTPKMFYGTGSHFDATRIVNVVAGGYWNGGNGAVDGFQVLMAAGNITSGVIKIYGIQ